MSKKYVVNKCGGGIMMPALLPLVKNELQKQIKNDYSPIVVVSAIKDVTDTIILFLENLSKNKFTIQDFLEHLKKIHLELFETIKTSPQTKNLIVTSLDKIMVSLKKDLEAYVSNPTTELEAKITAYGEKLSATCVAEYFFEKNLKTTTVFAEDIPLLTDAVIKDANILYEESEKNFILFMKSIKNIPIIAGFTGRTSKGITTLLGRGGTDTTACFVGAALRASKVILWKDVGAVYSADPKLVPKAHTIPFLSYDEIEEAGKVIQGKAVRYLRQYKIDAEIASLKNSKDKTVVRDTKYPQPGAKMVSFKKNLTLFSLRQGDARGYERLFEISNLCARHKINVVLIWNDPAYLHVSVEDSSGHLSQLIQEVKTKIPEINIETVHMITVVGSFNWKDVNLFNKTLNTFDPRAIVGAYPYPNCRRMEGMVVSKKDIVSLLKIMHKTFIHK